MVYDNYCQFFQVKQMIYQSFASLALLREIQWWTVDFPLKCPVMWEAFRYHHGYGEYYAAKIVFSSLMEWWNSREIPAVNVTLPNGYPSKRNIKTYHFRYEIPSQSQILSIHFAYEYISQN